MFKPKQKNRRKRGSQHLRRRSSTATLSSIPEEEFLLNAEIGSLDDLLADLENKPSTHNRELSRQDILPPPEPRLAHHHPSNSTHVGENSSRRGMAQFIFLLLIALGLIFWLFYTGG